MLRKVIVALISSNNCIAVHGKMPFLIPSYLDRLRRLPHGEPVIMSRKMFYESNLLDGIPLVDRMNIVVTRSKRPHTEETRSSGMFPVPSYEDALTLLPRETERVFVIGGARLYKQALPTADEMRLTYVDKMIRGDEKDILEWYLSQWRRGRDEGYKKHHLADPYLTRYTTLFREPTSSILR